MFFARLRTFGIGMVVAASLGALSLPARPAQAQSTITVSVIGDFSSRNPYADSTAQMYGIWCQVYGCLGTYDPKTADYKGMLAESWEVDPNDHNVWLIHLRKGLKRHGDGKELSAEDVVHSIWRTKNDPHTAQAPNLHPIKSAEAADQYTVRITTTEPTADIPGFLFDTFIVTAKDLFDKYGADKADRDYPLGWGPYALKQIVIGQRIVLEKNPNWPGIKKENPDRLIFIRVKEDEARVTGLLNGEIQIAQLIPPHLIPRIEKVPGMVAKAVPSVEGMFLGMNSKFKPWDNKLARQAVAYAIDRDLIIRTILQGHASKLQGPVGQGQYGWSPDVGPKYDYNPQKARALLEQAGLVGTEIQFSTTVNRYLYDRQAAEAMVPMLEAVGFKVKLLTPDYATEFDQVKKGNRPFFYHGRGSMIDPSAALSQMFETGVSPRIRYSNPEFDKVIAESRSEFDPEKRKKLLQRSFSILLEDVPAFWLWRLNILYGVDTNKVEYTPTPHNRTFGTEMIVKK
jgi:peptide/nickel transport system substrate-binding protein